ncbi:MAG: type II secretion system F family protein [Bacillota bacterium]
MVTYVIARRLLKKEDTEGFSERVALRIPGWGRILRNSYLVRFGKTFATLLESGARVLPALEYSGQATGSALYIKASSEIRKEVERGGRIGDSMRKTGAFPALFCELAAAGESSGTLPEMVSKAAGFYEGEVNRMLSSLSSLSRTYTHRYCGSHRRVFGYHHHGTDSEGSGSVDVGFRFGERQLTLVSQTHIERRRERK